MKKIIAALIISIFSFGFIVVNVAICSTPVFAATKKKEKKKSVGKKADGGAKVWNGTEFTENADTEFVPVQETTIKTGVYGQTADNSQHYIKPGSLKKEGDNYYYYFTNGGKAELEWVNVDIDNDGLYEYLYFGPSGILKINGTTQDGYKVNGFGAWVDENGNVKKLTGFVAESNVGNNNAVLSNTITSDRNGEAQSIVQIYLLECSNKNVLPQKLELKEKLRSSNFSIDETDTLVETLVNWPSEAVKYAVYKISTTNPNHIVTKEEIKSDLIRNNYSESDINNAILNCGVTDWDKYYENWVQDIVNSSAFTKDYRILDQLVKRGLRYDVAINMLTKVLGRELDLNNIDD